MNRTTTYKGREITLAIKNW